jgi:hypothetical protein
VTSSNIVTVDWHNVSKPDSDLSGFFVGPRAQLTPHLIPTLALSSPSFPIILRMNKE